MEKPKVFISYSTRDTAWARQFAEALAAQEVEVWFDANRIPPGQPVREELEKGFRRSDIIVMLITPESVRAPNLFFEMGAAVATGKTVVPVILKEMDLSELPAPLRLRQVVVRSTPKETAKQLAAHLKTQPQTA